MKNNSFYNKSELSRESFKSKSDNISIYSAKSKHSENSHRTKEPNPMKVVLTPNEEVKLGNFMKINYYIKNQNIKQVDEIVVYEKQTDDVEENKEEFQDRLLLQLKDLDKVPLISSNVIYFNNEIIAKTYDKVNKKKKKKKQNLNLQSMVLMGKMNNITGLEEKTTTYLDNNNMDLDERLNYMNDI